MTGRSIVLTFKNFRQGAICWSVCMLAMFVTVRAFAAPPPGYYDSADATNGATLRNSLHDIIDDHVFVRYTSTSTDTWDVLESADEDPNNQSNILDVYKNASYVKVGGGTGDYNREHSWPKSYGFPEDSSTQINAAGNSQSNYPYTDCHHLFLSDIGYNSSRNNLPYDTCSAACTELTTDVNNGQGGGSGTYPGNSNWRTGSGNTGTWETWVGRRGNVARALFYMDVRYDGSSHSLTGAAEPDLILTDNDSLIVSNTTNNQPVAYMGILSTLLQWHVEDPVDDVERQHNEAAFTAQGNRNPFIDHPEWVDCVFNNNCTAGCSVPADCDDGLFCNGAEDCVGGVCQSGSDPCPGESCDEVGDTCFTPGADPWINEFHYDNISTDTGEFIEIAGPAGASLANWRVIGYNGATGDPYDTIFLSGTFVDQGGCIGVLDFDFAGMQNGSPDGLALVDDQGAVVEFISYEGSFTAISGPASGLTSTDVGVVESNSTTPVGDSLQLTGTGAQAADFTWQSPAPGSRGLPNTGQSFDACAGCGGDPDCDDGLFCNGVETCVSGSCQSGSAVDCDDGVACTDDSCNESSDTCDNIANDGNCDNGLFCDGAEICNPVLDCQSGSAVDCDDGVACTDDSCNESSDTCDNIANDGNCDNGLFCDGAEICDPVLDCQSGSAVDCDDAVLCTDDACNESIDACDNIANDFNCDNGLFCDGSETCDPVLDCQSGSDPCPGQSCDEVGDICTPLTCNDNGECEAGEDCNNCPGDCFAGGGGTCPNGVCEAADGEDCVTCPADCNGHLSGKPANRFCCGDGTAEFGVTCSDPVCTEGGFDCTDVPSAGSCCGDGVCESSEDEINCAIDCACLVDPDCDDGDLCTIDTCNAGVCFNDPVDCDDADACTADTCDPGTGMCSNDPISCDDGDACTSDSCDPVLGCENVYPACGLADGCCGPACDPANDPDCFVCGAGGEPCANDGDCCSGKCKGNGTCR